MKIEDTIVKIYKCFYLYDVTVSEIHTFYDKTDVELKILKMTVCVFSFSWWSTSRFLKCLSL